MKLGFLTENNRERKKFVSVMLLNFGALSWFFVFNNYMEEIFTVLTPNNPDWGFFIGNSLFYGSIIFWSITISFIGSRINRRKLLIASIILGILSTIFLGLIEGTIFTSIICFLMGTSLGLGLPSSMALVADYAVTEKRGQISGVIVLGTFVIAFISMAIHRILNLDILGIIPLMVVLRSISLFALIIEKLDRPPTIRKKVSSVIYEYKNFLIYLIPWIMFAIASSLAWSLIPEKDFPNEIYLGNTIRYILIALFGLVTGVIADRYGRKQPIIIGLLTLGLGFSLLGFNITGTSVIIYLALSGITWGSFFVVFLVVPGDLSPPSSREKFYALGYILPLTGIFAISAIPVPQLPDIISSSQISQILGFCIFLAIYPVIRAKETLAESKMYERKMKEHLEKVGKIIQEEKD